MTFYLDDETLTKIDKKMLQSSVRVNKHLVIYGNAYATNEESVYLEKHYLIDFEHSTKPCNSISGVVIKLVKEK